MHLTHLACGACDARHDAGRVQTVCTACGQPLLARYDLAAVDARGLREAAERRADRGLWAWGALLPLAEGAPRLTLGEGATRMLGAPRLAATLGLRDVWVKEEGLNPTGTFKARGLCVAVSKAVELGVRAFAIPTAGNAGVALAAYVARADAQAHVFMPEDAPPRVLRNAALLGARVATVPGTIADAGRACRAFVEANSGTLDVATLKEPYRVEGKKTMGLEVAADLDWSLPDVVVYPTGGGTGIVGMHKAFEELEALGLVEDPPPRLVSVQAEGCAPLVKAFHEGRDAVPEAWTAPATSAAGLRVPRPFADRLVLRALRATEGTAAPVAEKAIAEGVRLLAREGILASPEGGAAVAGLARLVEEGDVARSDRVVVFNTGSAMAY